MSEKQFRHGKAVLRPQFYLGPGNLPSTDKERLLLRKENQWFHREGDILKRDAYFARESL